VADTDVLNRRTAGKHSPEMNSLIQKAQKIKLVLLDVDGVMTNGQILLMPNGDEVKIFSILDGFGIVAAMKAGIRIGIISGRASPSIQLRCQELKIDDLFMDIEEKFPVLQQVAAKYQIPFEAIAYIGDDVPDLPVLEKVGLSAAPLNAHSQVRRRVDLVLKTRGGEGAVREFLDFLLFAQRKEKLVLQKFTGNL
jgi:3-deoxy-D-manno-octulosonate 8-phosphate phosphatase (KDO 8-P phosphatase)